MHCKFIDLNIDHNLLKETYFNLGLDSELDLEPFQVAVQCRKETALDNQKLEGCGSLIYDWQLYEKNPNGKMPLRSSVLKEADFNVTCDYVKNTYIETVINELSKKHEVLRGRFLKMSHKTCLSWHVDQSMRIHIPIYTNKDCMMIVDDEIIRMPFGHTYIVDTTKPHTALNASKTARVHLVFCVR